MIRGCQKRLPDLPLDEKNILKGIKVVSAKTLDELVSVLDSLQIQSNSKIRLVIIDSLSLAVQCSLADVSKRAQFYFRICDKLQRIATKHNAAVVLVNELRSSVDAKGETVYSSAGGQHVAHRVSSRLLVARLNDSTFAARILKCSTMPQISIKFCVTENSVRSPKSKTNRRRL